MKMFQLWVPNYSVLNTFFVPFRHVSKKWPEGSRFHSQSAKKLRKWLPRVANWSTNGAQWKPKVSKRYENRRSRDAVNHNLRYQGTVYPRLWTKRNDVRGVGLATGVPNIARQLPCAAEPLSTQTR